MGRKRRNWRELIHLFLMASYLFFYYGFSMFSYNHVVTWAPGNLKIPPQGMLNLEFYKRTSVQKGSSHDWKRKNSISYCHMQMLPACTGHEKLPTLPIQYRLEWADSTSWAYSPPDTNPSVDTRTSIMLLTGYTTENYRCHLNGSREYSLILASLFNFHIPYPN